MKCAFNWSLLCKIEVKKKSQTKSAQSIGLPAVMRRKTKTLSKYICTYVHIAYGIRTYARIAYASLGESY